MDDILIAYAPYLSVIIGALLGVLSYFESKRKTKHDEWHELYSEMKKENEELKKENLELRKKVAKLEQ